METSTSTPSYFRARERWVTTALLGLWLVTFAIDASNTQLILPQVMTTRRVDLYESHAPTAALARPERRMPFTPPVGVHTPL